jgi:hypothetical protein
MKKFRALEAEVMRMKKALNNVRFSIQTAQTNVSQPGGASTLITEGPTSGSGSLKGDSLDLILNNPGGK